MWLLVHRKVVEISMDVAEINVANWSGYVTLAFRKLKVPQTTIEMADTTN